MEAYTQSGEKNNGSTYYVSTASEGPVPSGSTTAGIEVQNAAVTRIKTSSGWKEGVVWIKASGTWREADVVKIKTSSGWKESE